MAPSTGLYYLVRTENNLCEVQSGGEEIILRESAHRNTPIASKCFMQTSHYGCLIDWLAIVT